MRASCISSKLDISVSIQFINRDNPIFSITIQREIPVRITIRYQTTQTRKGEKKH